MIGSTPLLYKIIAPVFLILIFCAYWVYSFLIVYHLFVFGIGAKPKIIAAIFVIGSLTLFAATVYAITSLNFADVINKLIDIGSRIQK
ncbi:hypothetical protein HY838_02095 [Candidatus Azambacteria bacterium]|nr:hypothetical protein [Candidatus Azambacteria bacterium]